MFKQPVKQFSLAKLQTRLQELKITAILGRWFIGGEAHRAQDDPGGD